MVDPSVPSAIAAFPSATGIETFKRHRIVHLSRWAEWTAVIGGVSTKRRRPEDASLTSRCREACERKRLGQDDRQHDRRAAMLREVLFVPCRVECGRINLFWDSLRFSSWPPSRA